MGNKQSTFDTSYSKYKQSILYTNIVIITKLFLFEIITKNCDIPINNNILLLLLLLLMISS